MIIRITDSKKEKMSKDNEPTIWLKMKIKQAKMSNLGGGVFYANMTTFFFLLPNIQTLIFTWDVVNTMINRHYMWNYSKYNEKKEEMKGDT